MRLTTKRRVERLEASTVHNSEFHQLINFVNDTVVEKFNDLESDYQRLKRHISNNGLWRAVKELRKRVEDMHLYQQNMARTIANLETNGVATAINNLNKEVFGETKNTGSEIERVMAHMAGFDMGQEPTLSAKVDAIIEHLGLEVTVTPEKVTRTPAKITAKKAKKTTKKGRK